MTALPASAVFERGFFASQPVHVALLAGGIVAFVSGVIGVFTVIRGQSFAGHAFSDIGTTGGSGAYLLGVGALWGFLGIGVAAAAGMQLIGVERRRGRDVATGIVLGAALGLAALFLYWDATSSSTTGATQTILFGSLFTVAGSTIPAMIAFSLVLLAAAIVLYRPLLLCSINTDIAAARGIPVRGVSMGFLLMMAMAVALSSITVGAILGTALLIGPAATALRLTKQPATAMVCAGLIGVAAVVVGVIVAYDSASWPGHHGWPVSFCVVATVFLLYLAADLRNWWGARRQATQHHHFVPEH